jgi:hypothetical protein
MANRNGKHKKKRVHSVTSDSEEELEVAKTVLAPITRLTEVSKPHQNEESSSESGSEEEESKPTRVLDIVDHKTVKRRRTENGVVATAVEVQVETGGGKKPETTKMRGKETKRGGVPFQRIKVDKLEFQDSRLMDNTFAARVSSLLYSISYPHSISESTRG